MRAALPSEAGTVERNGVRVPYEVFGTGDSTIVLMPTWCVVHARIWKMQVPYLSRHFRVITWDGPGNGAADRPPPDRADLYSAPAHVEYALAVLDATSTASAVLVASSGGTHRTLRLAADHSERVDGVVFVGPSTPLSDEHDAEVRAASAAGNLDRFLDVFMPAAFTERHSTKAIEDGKGWGHETTMGVLVASYLADQVTDVDGYRSMCARIDCPVLVVQGTEDRLTPTSHGRELVDAIGSNASLVLVEGGGHRMDVRDPVRFSLLLRSFVDRVQPRSPAVAPSRFVRSTHRRPRALYLSSPIGLGHARRDVAIAKELRSLRPDLEIDWLAQDPVTRVLGHEGERIHPASEHLVSEAAHIESESAGHDLHCFQAWRRMDETLVANFMVLHDVLEAEHYDLVIGDEAWDADHFLHENPELKRSPFAWLTDFVGWLPVAEGGSDEPALTADYNAEMIEHVARYPWVRDRSIFVGNPDDIVPDTFGADLPSIRAWTEEHFEFSGYITGLSASDADIDREELRAALGFQPDELVCVATVGGSSVGTALLDAVVAAFPLAKAKLPELRMLAVTGPRIDPRSLAELEGMEAVGFVPDLWRHLIACDLAVVQGGLTTAMELTSAGRPFLYFPLLRHFEQQFHVPHRLARYGAGRRMDYATTDREELANAIVEEAGRPVSYRPVETDGAHRAARLLADLI